MIKIVALIRRHPDLGAKEFKAYWADVHVPLVRERLPGLIHYTGSFPLPVAQGAVLVDEMNFDAIVELGFPDRTTMEAQMGSLAFLSPEREASSAYFMDQANSCAMVVEEIDVLPKFGSPARSN